MGPGKGDTAVDIKRCGEIDRKLCRTSMEHKRQRHKFQEDTDSAERSSENRDRGSQNGQY